MFLAMEALILSDQGLVAKIHQHRMMLDFKPATENFEAAVLRPGRFVSVPTIELIDENVLAELLQKLSNALARFALWDEMDRGFENQVLKRQFVACWVGFV